MKSKSGNASASTPKRALDARQVLARGLVTRAMRAAGFLHVVGRRQSLTVLTGVAAADADAISAGFVELARSRGWYRAYGRTAVHDWTEGGRRRSERRDASEIVSRLGEDQDPELVMLTGADDVPPLLSAACDGIAAIGPLDAALVGAAFRIVLRGRPSDADLELAATLPLHLLPLAIRGGRSVREAMAAIRRLAVVEKAREIEGTPSSIPAATIHTAPRLEELEGLGEAGEWGRTLLADLVEYRAGRLSWEDLDRGALLVGPPGVGKTMFASALARSAGVTLHAHSLATWQARGHLGDLLKAMVKAFDIARRDAPCILLIDEIDSVGSREDPGDRYPAYTRQVVNGLLEQLDGTAGREGVVVLGATNLPKLIDPAILRPGRLDRTVAIPLPSARARRGILRHHLRGALPGEDLADVATRMAGFSGADIERAVRDARRAARTARRAMATGDLMAALPEAVRLSEVAFRRACVHEAGHWVVGTELGSRAGLSPLKATVPREIVGGTAGWTDFSRDPGIDRTRDAALCEIAILLAGTAAEEVVLGDRGDGVGGRVGSDLHRATAIAARLELSQGLGSGLAHLFDPETGDSVPGLMRDPAHRGRVEAVLAEGLSRARSVILERRHEVERTAVRLAVGTVSTPSGDDRSRVVEAEGEDPCTAP